MTEIIKNEAGEDVEVFTKEELEEQTQTAIDEYKEEHPDQTDEIDALKIEIEEKETELKKAGDKDHNFKKLREQKSELEDKLKETEGAITEKITKKLDSAISKLEGNAKNEIVSQMAGDDEDLKKKINFHYDRIKDEASTKEEIEAKLKDAYTLATKQEAPKGNYMSSAGAGNVKASKNITPEQRELAAKLGITEEELTKKG